MFSDRGQGTETHSGKIKRRGGKRRGVRRDQRRSEAVNGSDARRVERKMQTL